MAGPVNPGRRPRQRLATINNPSAVPNLQSKPSSPPPPPPPVQRRAATCCDNPEIGEDDDGRTVCFSCATVFDDSQIVAEVTFGETSTGAAMVQGGLVANDQRYANTMGGAVSGMGGVDSRQNTMKKGQSAIAGLCAHLGVPDIVLTSARRWYQLALNHSFVQGRGVMKVAAVSIYLAARKQPGNTLMLMDLAERLRINVWDLGNTYRKFCQTIMENDPEEIDGSTSLLQIEPLMLKFCQKLEFDQDSFRVASDACLILKRMSRDWMVQGRNPAGLCGACIILAARMNNFRRTVREVVYVVKVADTTINQRLYEYRRTQSAALTVKQFREVGLQLKTKIAPPAVYKRHEREERAAGRKRKAEALENGESEDSGDVDDSRPGSSQPKPSKPTKRQASMRKKKKEDSSETVTTPVEVEPSSLANGEVAEDMVVDVDALAGDNDAGLDALANAENAAEVDEEAISVPKRRGRPRKKREPIVIPPEDLELEGDLENEMIEAIGDWESTFKEFKENENHPTFVDTFERARRLVELHKPDRNVNSEEEIGEDEFEDDPDIRNVLCSEEEVLSRERIWILDNEDWLREQQKKLLAKALEEAQGKPKKPKQKRRRLQMGDGSVLEGQPAASAAEAAKKMIKKRAKHFSSHINYDVFKEIIPGGNTPSSGGATPAEQAATPEPEQQPPPPDDTTYKPVPVGEDDEEPEEDGYEEQYAEEDEDLEHQYMSDEDQGFDENENYDF
ncbi:transcription factor TFIIIB subunit brf1 [Kalmusia sp. IMI 367209]|nr:transcription factor TFIIIB subunit brf1 [Kalmusia sp. IMI 367209]